MRKSWQSWLSRKNDDNDYNNDDDDSVGGHRGDQDYHDRYYENHDDGYDSGNEVDERSSSSILRK